MFSMVHTASMATADTPLTLDLEVSTAGKLPLASLDLALSDLWALEVVADSAVLAERPRGQVDRDPAPVAGLHLARRKLHVS